MSWGDLWIVVPNWDEFQHYKDRSPVWIRLYVELLDRPEYVDLPLWEKGLLQEVWLLYARTNGQLRVRDVSASCQTRVRRVSFERLNHAGFIELSASKPLAQRQRQRHIHKRPLELSEQKLPVENVEKAKRQKVKGWADGYPASPVADSLNGVAAATKLLGEIRDADLRTSAIVQRYAAELPEAHLGRALEALQTRRAKPGTPLDSESRYVVATLRELAGW